MWTHKLEQPEAGCCWSSPTGKKYRDDSGSGSLCDITKGWLSFSGLHGTVHAADKLWPTKAQSGCLAVCDPSGTGSAQAHASCWCFLTSGWLSDETEGSRSSMARTAPGWMTTMSVEEEEDAGWEELAKWSFRSARALTGAEELDEPW